MTSARAEITWFLFTDIVGSTARWEEHPDAMPDALARHDSLLTTACTAAGGTVIKHTGDGVVAVFSEPSAAVAAAVAGQLALAAEEFAEVGELRARMGVHGGQAHRRANDYFGSTLNRAARVMSVAHGGQIVVSDATRQRVGGLDIGLDTDVVFVDLGLHRLKGLTKAERLHQVCHAGLPTEFAPLSSMNVALGNLPASGHDLLGREREAEQIRTLLGSGLPVTLIGPGGVGKTALAQHVGRSMLSEFPDGVWFCDLSGVRADDLVAETVASTLGIERRAGRTTVETLREVLAARHLLLIVDNCEHLVGEVADVLTAVRAEGSPTRLLATSRRHLSLAGEARFSIEPLAIPGETSGADALRAYASVRLFIERAAEAGRTVSLDGPERHAVARICNELDGLPLAIELAAARTTVMSVVDIADRLDRRLRLLGRTPDGDDRRRTLDATLDWSYELLSPLEQTLFQKLGTFDGGFDLEAVVEIAGLDEFDALDLLQGLVDKSIVVSSFAGDRARYRLLEVVREYALARLVGRHDVDDVVQRHARHYAAVVRGAGPRLRSDDQPDYLDRLRLEVANLRRSFEWLLANDPDIAAQMPLDLWSLWTSRNLTGEGIRWFTLARHALPREHPLLARVLDDLASLLWVVGENEAGEEACHASIAVAQSLRQVPPPTTMVRLASIWALGGRADDAYGLLVETIERLRGDDIDAGPASILCVIGAMLAMCGHAEEGVGLCERGLASARGKGPGLLVSACDNSSLAYLAVDPRRSLALALEAVENARTLRSTYSMGNALQALALAQRFVGDHDASRQTCAEALGYIRDAGMRNAGAAVLECLADQLREEPEAAATIYGAVAHLRRQIASAGLVGQQHAQSRRLNRLRDALGDERFETASAEGGLLGFDEAVDFACSVVEEADTVSLVADR